VERRLLRTDRRSESTYYELSHDALVQPVLASGRTQALVVGWTAVVAGSIVSLVAVFIILGLIFVVAFIQKSRDSSDYFMLLFFGALFAGVGSLGALWVRSGIRRRRRYGRRAPSGLS